MGKSLTGVFLDVLLRPLALGFFGRPSIFWSNPIAGGLVCSWDQAGGTNTPSALVPTYSFLSRVLVRQPRFFQLGGGVGIHEKLTPFSSLKNVKKFSKVLVELEKDLAEVGCRDFEVELREKEQSGSAIKRFFTLEGSGEADQWLIVQAAVDGRKIAATIPMRRGVSLPYSVEIQLNAPVGWAATYQQAFAGKKWVLEPENKNIAKGLKQIKLPDLNWVHASGGLKHKLAIGFTICGDEDEPTKSIWIIHSGYQGFLVGVGPKVAKYIQAAPSLEQFLSTNSAS